MGTPISDFVVREERTLNELSDTGYNTVAVDTYTWLHAFVEAIPGGPGVLTDEQGRTTSHLQGLYPRTMNMIEAGIYPVFILEGGYPDLKEQEIQRREEKRRDKREAEMRRFLTEDNYGEIVGSKIDDEVLQSAIDLIEAMGCAHITPPGEGEAQAARMCENGQVDTVVSVDYDTLLFGSDSFVQNLTSTSGDLIDLEGSLEANNLTYRELIWMGLLLGTDYNESPYGVGPKTAQNIVDHSESISGVTERASEYDDIDEERWRSAYKIYTQPNVDLGIKWEPQDIPDRDKIREILVEKHGFSENRVMNKIEPAQETVQQGSLHDWTE